MKIGARLRIYFLNEKSILVRMPLVAKMETFYTN